MNFTISHRQLVAVNENVSFCTNELICVILGSLKKKVGQILKKTCFGKKKYINENLNYAPQNCNSVLSRPAHGDSGLQLKSFSAF